MVHREGRSLAGRVRAAAGRAWREYTRMRTAIYLLMAVAFLVLIGSFVPQDQTSADAKVQDFITNHGYLNALTSAVGLPLTQVFVSPVFYVTVGLLYVSLGACVIRRFRALLVRTVRRYARSPQFWGECGSWIFHASFLLLVVAAVLGKATGFQGLVAVTEGTSFSETRSGYDSLQEGVLFNGQHSGFQVHLNSFSATYQPSGEAADYVSNVTVVDHGQPVLTQDIRVNDYLSYDGDKVYLMDYGWAPHIVVRNPAGQVVYDGYTQFLSPSNDGTKSSASGVLKVPGFGYVPPGSTTPAQLGAEMVVMPDGHPVPALNADGSINPSLTDYSPGGQEARNPVIEMKFFLGDLGLNQAQNVNALDTRKMVSYFQDGHAVSLLMGQTLRLPVPDANGIVSYFTVSFPDLRQYSFFMVNRDAGVPWIYASFVLILTGLMTKLYLKPLLQARQRRLTLTGHAQPVPQEVRPLEPDSSTPVATPRR